MSIHRLLVTISVAFLVGGVLTYPASVSAQQEKPAFQEITGSLSCYCGCGLLLADCAPEECATSRELRQEVRNQLSQDKNNRQVIQSMVSIYGEKVLAAPPKSGFNLSAYILPFVFLILGASIVYSIARRWMGGDDQSGGDTGNGNPAYTGDDALKHRSRIEEELRDFDT